MKKVLVLTLGLCFLFSSFAQASVQSIKAEKHKTEKVLFEAVAVSSVEVLTSKNQVLVNDFIVLRHHGDSAKETSNGFAFLQKQNFVSSRYWYRNYDNYNYDSKEICQVKIYRLCPEKHKYA
jgi:hypothetical protein